MLELRPNCEMCDRDLPPDSSEARICSYVCAFCVSCVDVVLHNVCPNCGGGFVPRPIRPARALRDGTGRRQHPASTKRRKIRWTTADNNAFVRKLHITPPADR